MRPLRCVHQKSLVQLRHRTRHDPAQETQPCLTFLGLEFHLWHGPDHPFHPALRLGKLVGDLPEKRFQEAGLGPRLAGTHQIDALTEVQHRQYQFLPGLLVQPVPTPGAGDDALVVI